MKKKFIPLFFLCIILIIGCKAHNVDNNSFYSPGETKKELFIMTSFYPVYITTLNITKDVPGVKVINLTPPVTGCLHNYSLTSNNMKDLALADIFVINGAGMESFLDKVIKENSDLKIVEASKDIELIRGTHEEYNPHVWTSVSNLIKQVENIQKDLSKYDPAHSELYKENALYYIERLYKLKTDIKEGLKDIKNRNIITFHEAFPYFAKEFDLNIVAVIQREPGTEPNARELTETINLIKGKKVKALFIEPQYPKNSADVISRETGLKLYNLDPVVTGPIELDAYIKIMNRNLLVLQEALR